MSGMVNGKHLNASIDLNFNANTSKAKKDIQDLQGQLNNLLGSMAKDTGEFSLNKDLGKATEAAIELKRHLEAATDVKTGKLDLSALSKSFQSAGRDLSHFREGLSAAGPEGQKIFNNFANSIMKAEVPLRKTSALLTEFGVTLKNTARWQISSSVLHGFMGTIQSAFHYAEDLNRSLNNIRIVTGQNTEQMAAFAKQANESAKALSTTTTKYTDAALIYYQQGLDDKQVKERTDVTVKMANVARESAEEVSNQMTAVWNNFNKDGSEAAESFADKMTALGAATASSTSEIAEGLSKFAGIADTIGLSFDYATSALATVTATSRESADVVGTAFKTIFARIEGLKQGKTLEDGTELNQYSQGLAKIGVQVKDENGELKNMDTILEDMGKKWQSLTRDQKVATAQTVAGIRQYNQLMTLMDNWDFFQKNLSTAQGSKGTLQKQADIYAESWEAARDRVTAAAEEIYSQLINDKFFIDLNNGFAGFLGIISNTIKSLGGLKGVLSGLGVLATSVFGKQIASSLDNLFSTSKKRMEEWKGIQDKAIDDSLEHMNTLGIGEDSDEIIGAYENLRQMNENFIDDQKHMSDAQKQQAKGELEQYKDTIDAAKEYCIVASKTSKTVVEAREKETKSSEKLVKAMGKVEDQTSNITKLFPDEGKEVYSQAFQSAGEKCESFVLKYKELTDELIVGSGAFKDLSSFLQTLGVDEEKANAIAKDYIKTLKEQTQASNELNEAQENRIKAQKNNDQAQEQKNGALQHLSEESQRHQEAGGQIKVDPLKTSEKIVRLSQAFFGLSTGINTVNGLMETWSHVARTGEGAGDALLSSLTSLGMAIPSIVSSAKALSEVFKGLSAGLAGGIIAGISIGLPLIIKLGEAFFGTSKTIQEQAQEMSESVATMQQRLEDSKNAYEDLKSSLEDYHSARDALKELETGTTEWKDAVKSLNEQVLDLINKYPELAKWVKNVNGHLELVGEGEKELERQQQDTIDLNRKITTFGEAQKGIIQEKANINTYVKGTKFYENSYDANNSTYNGGQSGIGNKDSTFMSKQGVETNYTNALNKIIEATEKYGNDILKDAKTLESYISFTDIEKRIVESELNSIRDFIPELSVGRDAIKTNLQALADSFLEGKEAPEGFSEFLSNWIKNFNIDDIKEDIEDKYDKDEEGLRKKYAQQNGLDPDAPIKEDDDGNVIFQDRSGNELAPVTDDQIKDFLVYKEAFNQFNTEIPTLTQNFDKARETVSSFTSSDKQKNALMNFIQSGTLTGDLTKDDVAKLKGISADQLTEGANKLGVKDFDSSKQVQELQQQLENFDFSDITHNMLHAVQNAFSDLQLDDVGYEGQKAIANALDKVLDTSGEEAMKNFADTFKKAQAKGQGKEFAEAINDLQGEWDNLNVDELKERFSELGVTTKFTDKELQDLIDGMGDSGKTAKEISQQYGEVHKIINGLKEGDIVSDDDYKKLAQASDKTEEYFTTMLDGTHKLTGDAEKFYKAIEKDLLKDSQKDLAKKDEKLTSLNAVQDTNNYNFNQLSKQQSFYDNNGFAVNNKEDVLVNIQKQIDLVKALGDESEQTQSKIKEWQTALENNEVSTEMTKELAETVAGLREEYDKIPEKMKEINEERLKEIQAIYETANTVEELDEKIKQVGLDQDLYNKRVLEIRDQERVADLDTGDIKEYGKYLQDLADSEQKAKVGNQELSDQIGKSEKKAKSLATQIQRMNKGVEALSGNWKTWSKILKQGSEGADEHRKAVQGTRKAIADLADVSEDYVSIDFVESMADNAENMKLMEKAAKGDGKAIDELKSKLSDDIVQNVILKKNKFDGTKQELLTEHEQLKKLLSKQLNLKIGAKIDSKFTKQANEFIKKSKMTVDQANSYFRSLGVEPHFKTVYKDVTTKKPIVKTTTKVVPRTVTVPKSGHTVNGPSDLESETVIDKYETSSIVGYKSVKEKVAVPAISSDGKDPKVTFTSMGNGSINDSSSSNPGGGSSSGGGGRGGRSSAKKMTKMKKDKSKPAKRDPYWDENLAISRTSREINKTEQESNYKYGEQKVKLLEKQNELLRKQLKNYQALGKEQAKQEKALRNQAKKAIKKDKNKNLKGSGLGLKVKYDEDGYVSNYDGLMDQSNKRYKKQQKNYNKFVKDYNNFVKKYATARKKGDKKALKALEKQRKRWEKKRKLRENEWKAEQDLYKKRMDWIDKYTETEEAKQERKEQERELKREIIENNIEKWDVEIQLKIDTREAKREWDKFIKKMEKAVKTTTSHFHMSEAADKVTGNRDTLKDFTQDYKDKAEQMKTYDWISKNWDQYTKLVPESKRIASSASEAAEKANEYKKELEDIGENAMAELQEGWNTYLDSINEGIEAIDVLNDKLKTQGEILDYGRQMIEMVYGGKAYDKMDEYYKTQDKYLTTQQSTLEKQQKMYQNLFDKELAKAKAEDPTVDENNYLTWTDAMIAYYNAAQNAASQLRDTNLAYVQNQIDAYNNLVDAQMDSLERSLTGGSLLDEEIAKWEREKKEMDLYLDEQERTYQIQSLLNKYDNTINTTKDLELAKKLKKIKDEELQQLIEKGKLTKFDLDVANARYNVELKKIALEEAQKNKNSMKLSRNADGNWSYQYVANQDDIKNKGQELLDATNEWYEKSKDNQRRTKDTILSTWQEVIPQITEILKDQSLTIEDRIKKSEELAAWATRMSGSLADENCVSIQNMLAANAATLITAYETDSQSFEQYNKDKTGFIETFKQEGIGDFYELFNKFGIYAKDGATKLVEALATGKDAALPKIVTESYKSLIGGANTSSVLGAFNKAGDTIIKNFVTNKSSVYNKLTTTFGKIANAGITCWDKISEYIPEVMDSFNEVWLALDNINTEMGTVTGTVESDLDSIRNKIYDELIPAWNDYWNAVNQSKEDTEQEDGENPPEIPDQVQQNIDMSENKDVQKLMNPKYKYKAKKGGIKDNKNAVWSYGIVDVVGDYAIEKTKNGKKYKVIDMVTGKTKKTCKSLDAARDKAYGLWNKTLDKLQKDPLVQEAAQYGVDVLGERMRAGANHVGNKGITDIYEKKKKKNGVGMMATIYQDSIHFDTGGYTGDWGNDGKIAVLHQKELVLNQEDTNNILDAVNGIRDISSLNGSISNAITDSISGIFADSIKNAVGQTIGINTQKQNETYTIENITAEFPNAQNVDDIREAILSLPRLASQYVARNLK